MGTFFIEMKENTRSEILRLRSLYYFPRYFFTSFYALWHSKTASSLECICIFVSHICFFAYLFIIDFFKLNIYVQDHFKNKKFRGKVGNISNSNK